MKQKSAWARPSVTGRFKSGEYDEAAKKYGDRKEQILWRVLQSEILSVPWTAFY